MEIKYTLIFYLIAFIILRNSLFAGQGASELLFFEPGEGQSKGQSEEYFPENVFGLPDTNASKYMQSSAPEQICSIGMGGKIALGFSGKWIIDGPGPDFTVFENAFFNQLTGKTFAEPGVVSVSADGSDWIEFPYDYETLKGCAGLTETNGKADPFNPAVSGGNSFDLADIGIEKIRYVMIRDLTVEIIKDSSHDFFDPILSGFDLDAIVAINTQEATSADIAAKNHRLIIYNNILEIREYEDEYSLEIFDISGKKCYENTSFGETKINLSDFRAGVYFVISRNGNNLIRKKILIN